MTKNDIFESVLDLTLENNIEKISMRMIANKLNCSPSTLYHHFRDKEVLFENLYSEIKIKTPIELNNEKSVEKEIHHLLYFATSNRREFNFIRMYNSSSFLSIESKASISAEHCKRLEYIANIRGSDLSKSELQCYYYMIFGTLNELLKSEDNNPDNAEVLADLLCYGIMGKNK